MQTYTFATPQTITTGIGQSVTVKSVQLTALNFSTTPALAPMGTGTLSVTLTDPVTGYQQTFSYGDSSVLTFWETAAVAPDAGDQFRDTVDKAVFSKLIADGKLPAGALS